MTSCRFRFISAGPSTTRYLPRAPRERRSIRKGPSVTTTRNAPRPWNPPTPRIGYSHSTMTDDERMQRESSLIATIRKNLPDFAKACADDEELVLLHQDAFAADYQEDEFALLGMAINTQVCVARKCA